MKKALIYVLSICLLFVTSFTGYKIVNKEVVKIPMMTDQGYIAHSLMDLETDSDVIVLGRVLPGAKNVLEPLISGSVMGYTLMELEVLEVYKGNVQTRDVLEVTENYFIVETLTERQINYAENYCPSEENGEYIFFLHNSRGNKPGLEHTFYPLSIDRGRYPVLDELISNPSFSPEGRRAQPLMVDDFTNEELSLGDNNSTEYREIFKEVIEKYYR